MEFKHPKYYAELRALRKKHQASSIKQEATKKLCKRNRSFLLRKEECTLGKLGNNLDQAISDEASTEATSVRPGPGHKHQAASAKPQATEIQAASDKHQAPSNKPQASSRKQQAAQ